MEFDIRTTSLKEAYQKMEKEVLAMSGLNHPNIVQYYSCWIEIEDVQEESEEEGMDSLESIEEKNESMCFSEYSRETKETKNDWDESRQSEFKTMKTMTISKSKRDPTAMSAMSTQSEWLHKPGLCLYIQMQFCAGATLREFIDTSKEKKLKRYKIHVLKMFEDILNGINKIHRAKIIHRDLK